MEDTLLGTVRRIPVDMVVLSVGLEPREDAQDVRRLFNISCATEGFFLERHPKLAPVNTFTDGIFLAGCCQGPKDIPDTVAQAGAAAAEALALIDAGAHRARAEHGLHRRRTTARAARPASRCARTRPSRSSPSATGGVNKAEINEALCKGCGTCVAACPSGSIHQNLFEDDQIFDEIAGLLEPVR